MSVSSVGREEQSLPAEIRDLEAILARISAGASARDAHPAFPEDPFVRLAPTGALAIPVPDPIGTKSRRASFAEEWRVLRAIAGADGSVGRILERFS
jgi:alkylation response protein AidB-like acyl-CoA dehydrogenase